MQFSLLNQRSAASTGQRLLLIAGAAGITLLLGACVAPQRQGPARAAVPPTPPPTQVYFYPTAGQSEAQQDRDRYDCYLWAVKQTGYDPGQPQLAPHQRVVVEPMPPAGVGTVTGAMTGAVLGAAVSRPRDAAGGALIGAVAGAMVGAASDSAREARAAQVQQRYDNVDRTRYAELERRAQDYRRAMTACLEGRGYKVD